ncbi:MULTISPECIES: hypothetical protein [unclassified Pseudomonas]|uniref:hypothetical protein n=1 Tax=unclassified Pseudomonas TaxID=196821 RepID=UPI0030D703D2
MLVKSDAIGGQVECKRVVKWSAISQTKEAVRQASTIKANYWASTAVYFLGIVGIVVAPYYANQANVFVAIQTTLSAVQAGKVTPPPNPAMLPLPITPP